METIGKSKTTKHNISKQIQVDTHWLSIARIENMKIHNKTQQIPF
jgi:hypothetical protein